MSHLQVGKQEARVLILGEHHEMPTFSPYGEDEHRACTSRERKCNEEEWKKKSTATEKKRDTCEWSTAEPGNRSSRGSGDFDQREPPSGSRAEVHSLGLNRAEVHSLGLNDSWCVHEPPASVVLKPCWLRFTFKCSRANLIDRTLSCVQYTSTRVEPTNGI